jgi:hypothetical protein
MALAKTARTIIASASNAAGATVRGTLDLNAAQGGGILTFKITNGGTGPTVQCTGYVLVAHNATLPAAGSAGATWKTMASYGGGTTASDVTEFFLPIDPSIMCLCVEFRGNTGQAVTIEAFMSELTSAA